MDCSGRGPSRSGAIVMDVLSCRKLPSGRERLGQLRTSGSFWDFRCSGQSHVQPSNDKQAQNGHQYYDHPLSSSSSSCVIPQLSHSAQTTGGTAAMPSQQLFKVGLQLASWQLPKWTTPVQTARATAQTAMMSVQRTCPTPDPSLLLHCDHTPKPPQRNGLLPGDCWQALS